MKQVFASSALEAVLAAARRPPSNEDSQLAGTSSLGGLRRSFVTRPSALALSIYGLRARLCLLDPYGLSVDYATLEAIGRMGSVEIFFNFMVVGANRNVLWTNPARVSPRRRALMTRVWGRESWREELYRPRHDLFGDSEEKVSNEEVVEAYRRRLLDAGFKYVPKPVPMRNSTKATIYYLFFASPNATGSRIVEHIFGRYRA
jgi:three-Cys-motif partner protein